MRSKHSLEMAHFREETYEDMVAFVEKNINSKYPSLFFKEVEEILQPLEQYLSKEEVEELVREDVFHGLQKLLTSEFAEAYRYVKRKAKGKLTDLEEQAKVKEIRRIGGSWWELTFHPILPYYSGRTTRVLAENKNKQP